MAKARFLSLALIVTLSAAPGLLAAAHTVELIAPDVPARVYAGSRFIFAGSDSVTVNGVLQRRSESYTFEDGFFDFSSLQFQRGDTIRITFAPLPTWLGSSYGPELPAFRSAPGNQVVPPSRTLAWRRSTPGGENLKVAGSKSFRFSAGAAGGSDFGQSLDLRLSGELSPGLELTGTVSDRGYDPAYGTANSRLNELDKINLSLRSQTLLARVGDIDLSHRGAPAKQVSGVSVELTYPQWRVNAAAARPRGVFKTYRRMGADGYQGPYQVGDETGTRSIVPGSETVWLDGRELSRGADKDYDIDYAAGRITFSARNPIDARSRIEVDYEPQTTAYKKELFQAGGDAQLADSLVYFSMSAIREGDDRNQRLIGQLAEDDETRLAAGGDGTVSRSGVTEDTAGAFVLVVDSLPDSVYRFVGAGNGDYNVVFSFVGSGEGDYRFLGSGRYEFVGPGSGDYAPIVILTKPVRSDYYRVVAGSRSSFGELQLDLRANSTDENLFSTLDDGDNSTHFYRVGWYRAWGNSRLQVSHRYRQSGYSDRERLNRPDFERRHYLPGEFVSKSDERLTAGEFGLAPSTKVTVSGSFDILSYRRELESNRGELRASYRNAGELEASVYGTATAVALNSDSVSRDGEVTRFGADLLQKVWRDLWLSLAVEQDRRWNEYSSELRGTRYRRMELGAIRQRGTDAAGSQSITFERYYEDTLTGDWSRLLKRSRLQAAARGQVARIRYNGTLTRQWIERPTGDETGFLGRADLRYQSQRHRLNIVTVYALSEERRNARGFTYLEVESGAGDYILEDGRYVPDADGNYIQVEELLSDTSLVRRADKSFILTKQWSQATVRLQSEIQEELKPAGERSVWWLLPFVSDPDQPYLFYKRKRSGTIRALPVSGSYAVSLQGTESLESREIAGILRERRDRTAKLTLKQPWGRHAFEQELEVFEFDRDSLFTGAGSVDGYQVSLAHRFRLALGETRFGVRYRRADSRAAVRSDQVAVDGRLRIALVQNAEMRSSLELYDQTLSDVSVPIPYSLTANRPGNRGAIWQMSLDYGLNRDIRVDISLTGRHSDARPGRVTGRGEVVAAF